MKLTLYWRLLMGEYVVAGNAHSCELANRDVLILKYDTDGDLLWRKNYGGE